MSFSDLLLPRCTFPAPGSDVTCAVSGGADSIALLVLACAAGCRATAVHVDHGIRAEAGRHGEGAVVAAAAARLGAAFRSERVSVDPGPNLEARARQARFAVLPPDVLTGHTADDQAETVLLNMLRGAGLDGLAGMGPGRHPIIGLRRAETHALCADVGLTAVHDPTNDDAAFRRNRVRHELLPLLDDVAQRDVAALLARQADVLREEAALLDALAQAIDPTDAKALAAAPAPLARRAVRAWLRCDQQHPPQADAVERVLAVARGEAVATEVGGGLRVARSGQRLRLESVP
ncbi:MAG: tRNA lysidine(34) synthetase TilS, partial [Acidimicrobiia bacterium]|nr:tRNA lysidine(34) synthetase TilS [Acidimicrobiia bacterium]